MAGRKEMFWFVSVLLPIAIHYALRSNAPSPLANSFIIGTAVINNNLVSISQVCKETQTVSIMSWALASIGDCHFARGCMQVKRYDDQPYDDMRSSGLQRSGRG
jgi:hypothetical protein